jgi:hypothetical protein
MMRTQQLSWVMQWSNSGSWYFNYPHFLSSLLNIGGPGQKQP